MAPPVDLYVGTALNAAFATALFVAVGKAGKHWSARAVSLAALAVLAALGLYLGLLQDSVWLARLFPLPNALTLSNGLPLLAGILAGLLAARTESPRRPVLAVVLLLLGFCQPLRTLSGSVPDTRSHPPPWPEQVCPQTSDSTCSAASAATLLGAAGIAATETEMADRCLSRDAGTSMLGVYRGLRQKTGGTTRMVGTLTNASLHDLRATTERNGPVLISVGLPRWVRPGTDPRYARDWGWTPGLRHAVVAFGFLPNGKVDIGDPSVGREAWDTVALDVLWNGEGMYLTAAASAQETNAALAK